jgi:hypothetical protein
VNQALTEPEDMVRDSALAEPPARVDSRFSGSTPAAMAASWPLPPFATKTSQKNRSCWLSADGPATLPTLSCGSSGSNVAGIAFTTAAYHSFSGGSIL